MKVQLKTIMAGPQGTFAAGQVVELPEAEARRLVAGGFAISAEVVSLPLGGLTPIQANAPEPEVEAEPEEDKSDLPEQSGTAAVSWPETRKPTRRPAQSGRNRE